MASKSAYQASEKGAELEELLDSLEILIERLRATYEQYFLGITKMPPSQLHADAERRVRDMSQEQIKNTALRYRYATLSQKFGAYNTYWKRTLRQIEQGTYVRDLQRIQRQAMKNGEEIPEEILAAMPKLMRERVERDRRKVLAAAERQGRLPVEKPAEKPSSPKNVHRLDDSAPVDDLDIEGMFASLTREAEEAIDASPPSAAPPRKKGPTTPPLRPPSAMRTGGAPPPPIPKAATTPPPMPPVPGPVPRPQTTVASPPPPTATARSTPPSAVRSAIPAQPRPEVPAPPPGMDDQSTRALYQKYLKARELVGESNDGVTYDKLVRTLRSQSSKIMTDTRASGVEFAVVIKDNKVVLKAKPK